MIEVHSIQNKHLPHFPESMISIGKPVGRELFSSQMDLFHKFLDKVFETKEI